MLLCDCPGLVFPTFVTSKAEMVVSGILPIDQMRDHIPPVSLVACRIPRPILEGTYGIKLPHPQEGEDPDRPPNTEELCGAYGCEYALLYKIQSLLYQSDIFQPFYGNISPIFILLMHIYFTLLSIGIMSCMAQMLKMSI